MADPGVSVLLSNYNHSRYLPDSLGSMAAQTVRPAQMVIIDDGSTDDSVAVIERYAAANPFMTLLKNGRNMGVSYSCALGYKLLRCEYMFGMSADDKFMPGLIERSMEQLSLHPQAGFCCSDSRTEFDDGGDDRPNLRRLGDAPCYIPPDRLAAMMRGRIVYLSAFGSIFRKDRLDETGLLPDLKWHGDMAYAMIIGLRYGLCYVPEVLSVHRYLRRSYSAAGVRDRRQNDEVLRRLLDMLRTPGYADVLPRVKESCALACFEMPMLRFLLENREYRDFLSPRLAALILEGELKNGLGRHTPAALKALYRKLRGYQR